MDSVLLILLPLLLTKRLFATCHHTNLIRHVTVIHLEWMPCQFPFFYKIILTKVDLQKIYPYTKIQDHSLDAAIV
jgi:hypothetical protein